MERRKFGGNATPRLNFLTSVTLKRNRPNYKYKTIMALLTNAKIL